MKIKSGFVSNSSTSSFIVKYRDDFDAIDAIKSHKKIPVLLSKEEIKLLEDFGFQKVCTSLPSHIDSPEDLEEYRHVKGDYGWHFGYWVSVNQDEVILFLLENNIPFRASAQYQNEFWLYEKDSENILVFPNFGNIVEMYGYDDSTIGVIARTPKVKEMDKKKYIDQTKQSLNSYNNYMEGNK